MRMPPIFTNSASTPSIFIELIFSTIAGGKVFSMPNKMPIFFMIPSPSIRSRRFNTTMVHYERRLQFLPILRIHPVRLGTHGS